MRRLWILVAVLAPVALALDVVRGASMPGTTALTGFVGCAVIVYVSKSIGKAALARPEAYYADPDTEEGLGAP